MDFSLEAALQFDGETGPYVQYTHGRIQSIKQKSGLNFDNRPLPSLHQESLELDEMWVLLKELSRYPETIAQAVQKCEPSVLAKYLLSLCKKFNRYYQQHRMLGVGTAETETRVLAAHLTGTVLHEGLSLLGIEAPEKI